MNEDEPKKRGRKPATDGTNKVMVTFRISPEMKSWLDECAAKGAVKAEIFDLALELARYWVEHFNRQGEYRSNGMDRYDIPSPSETQERLVKMGVVIYERST